MWKNKLEVCDVAILSIINKKKHQLPICLLCIYSLCYLEFKYFSFYANLFVYYYTHNI